MQTLICQHCGTDFEVHPSRIKHGRGRHCSPACQYAAIKARPKAEIQFECEACKKIFGLARSKTSRKGAGRYCSQACRNEHRVGPNSPNWRNGGGVYKRGPRWHSIRRRILKRDKVCQHCGIGGPLHVHHKIPFRMWSTHEEANRDSNLIALCPPCHRREDAKCVWISPNKRAA